MYRFNFLTERFENLKMISVLFIINPVSGTESKQQILHDIETHFDRQKFSWQVAYTAYAGHGAVLATMAAENGYDMVVAIGGDGTVNEIARSLVHTQTILGIIPCGSGNGLARHLRIPLDSSRAIEILNQFNVRELDYGIINKRPFFCTCGMGFDATISYKFASSIKRGILSYLENTLKEITRYKPETYIIEDESGQQQLKAFLLTCANASQYGNNAYIAPEASMSDGLMDVTVIRPFTVVEAPQLAYQLFNGTLSNKGHITMFRSKKLHIIREHEGVIHCDGDPFKAGKEITVEIESKQLRAITGDDMEIKPDTLLQTITEAFSFFVSKGQNTLETGIKQAGKGLLSKLQTKH